MNFMKGRLTLLCVTALFISTAVFGLTFIETSGHISMEAEHFTAQTGYTEVAYAGASGGKVMQVGSSGHLDFEVSIKTPGTWYFWLRAYAPNSESNGIFLKVDNAYNTAPSDNPYSGVRDIYLKKGTWAWTPEYQGSGSGEHQGPIVLQNLSAGKHTISIEKRKTERPFIDKIVLTTAAAPPTGFGPPETAEGLDIHHGFDRTPKAGPEISVFPNPFNSLTRIAFSHQLSAVSMVNVYIYNVNGKIVEKLTTDIRQLIAGITWNASGMAPGGYGIRIKDRQNTFSKKIFILR